MHLYSNDKVTWLTDEKAVPLLRDNPLIDRIIVYSISGVLQLEDEIFDVVVNLEKNPGICALVNRINAWQKYGFRFDPISGTTDAYTMALEALYVAQDERKKKSGTKHWLEHLFAIVGHSYANEEYVMRDVKVPYQGQVLLNYQVGHKFVEKCWGPGLGHWQGLEALLRAAGLKDINYQHIGMDLDQYIDFIAGHECIVTCDSLGLHLGMAMGKIVVGLFGPTPAKEIYLYKRGIFIQKDKMLDIDIQDVCEAVKWAYRK